VLKYLREGLSRTDAATLAGTHYRTVRGWLKQAEDELARVEENPRARNVYKNKEVYVYFLQEYEKAEAEHRQSLVKAVKTSATGFYTIKEETTTSIYRNGTLYQEVKTEKTKEVGPDGNLAMKMLHQDLARESDDDRPQADPRMEMMSRILRMSPDELEALNDNLEAAL
jgi:transposase